MFEEQIEQIDGAANELRKTEPKSPYLSAAISRLSEANSLLKEDGAKRDAAIKANADEADRQLKAAQEAKAKATSVAAPTGVGPKAASGVAAAAAK